MKAFVVERYGKSGLRAAEVPEPAVGPHGVLEGKIVVAMPPMAV
jgi:NADPH:quinone reductase-like Zn-dependent oxidoreductase